MRHHCTQIIYAIVLVSFFWTARAACDEATGEVHIVHFGDSITAAKYVQPIHRLEAITQKHLRAAYNNDKIFCHNVSKGGRWIAKFMRPGGWYETKCLPVHKRMDMCFIMFAVNDEDHRTSEQFEADLISMCDRVERDYPGVKIVLCTAVHVKDRDWWAQMGADAEEPISRKHYSKTRQVAAQRGYLLVDVYKRTVEQMHKGNWDMFIRNQKLSREHYKKVIIDDSKDAERAADGTKWFKDVHPNVRGLELIADLEVEVLQAAYPEKLPSDGTVKQPSPLPLPDGVTWVFLTDGDAFGKAYPTYVEAYHHLRFPQRRVHFRTVGYDAAKLGDVLSRFDTDVAIWNPTVVSVAHRSTGAARGDQYQAILSQIVERIESSGAKPVLIPLAPAYEAGSRPGAEGQLLIASAILKSLGASGEVTRGVIDASVPELIEAAGCKITELKKIKNGISFVRHDDRLPLAYDDEAAGALKLSPEILGLSQYTLTVLALPPGSYRILVGGRAAGVRSADELSAGWNMTTARVGAVYDQLDNLLYLIRKKRGAPDRRGTVAATIAQARKLAAQKPMTPEALREALAESLATVAKADERIRAAAAPRPREVEIFALPTDRR